MYEKLRTGGRKVVKSRDMFVMLWTVTVCLNLAREMEQVQEAGLVKIGTEVALHLHGRLSQSLEVVSIY